MNRISPSCGLVALACFGAAALAQDHQQATILDRNLTKTPGTIEQITASAIHYSDPSGRPRSIDRSRVLAVYSRKVHGATVPTMGSAADRADGIAGVLRLSDGQIVPGFFRPGSKPEMLGWSCRRLGQFSVPLDHVASILFLDSASSIVPSGKKDLVLLTNDDRVEGFIESIGADLNIDVNGVKSTFPVDRVAAARLANPYVQGGDELIYLSDGSVLAAAEIGSKIAGKPGAVEQSTPVRWALAADNGAASVEIGSIDAVVIDPKSFLPLSSVPCTLAEPGGTRTKETVIEIADPSVAPLGLAAVTIRGPASVEWSLPAGAKRFGATLELPMDARPWGNTSVVVSTAGSDRKFREVLKKDFSSEAPSAECTVDLSGVSILRIDVRGRAYAEVQARVRMLEPVLLVTPAASASKPR